MVERTHTVLAGIGDRSADVLARIEEVIALNPKKVYLNILSNDIAGAVPSATYQSNYNAILAALAEADIEVILGTPVARTTNLTAAQTFINGKTDYQIVDLFAVTKNAGNTQLQAAFNSGDNIHLSPAGHTACAEALVIIV